MELPVYRRTGVAVRGAAAFDTGRVDPMLGA
jgi:hypothetical protein